MTVPLGLSLESKLFLTVSFRVFLFLFREARMMLGMHRRNTHEKMNEVVLPFSSPNSHELLLTPRLPDTFIRVFTSMQPSLALALAFTAIYLCLNQMALWFLWVLQSKGKKSDDLFIYTARLRLVILSISQRTNLHPKFNLIPDSLSFLLHVVQMPFTIFKMH